MKVLNHVETYRCLLISNSESDGLRRWRPWGSGGEAVGAAEEVTDMVTAEITDDGGAGPVGTLGATEGVVADLGAGAPCIKSIRLLRLLRIFWVFRTDVGFHSKPYIGFV